MQRRQLIKGLAAGAIVSTLLPAFAAEPVTLKVGASPLVTGDILEFVKPALAKRHQSQDHRIYRLYSAESSFGG